VESRHRGTVIGLDAGGLPALAVGEPERPVFPRSSAKPLQAVGMLRAGLDAVFSAAGGAGIPADLLAVVAGSHSGEPAHLAAVQAVLAAAGVGEDALRCPADLPLSASAAENELRAGGGRRKLLMNCSGKHAGMIATCVAAGWRVDGYPDPDHPVQRAIRVAVEDLTGEPARAIAVDGCGAPLFAVPLVGLARAFRGLATAPAGTPEHQVAVAMRTHPDLVGGSGRTDTELMRAVPGLIAKDGAEGVTAAATPDGRTVAVKIEDGGKRSAMPALVAALDRLGVTPGGAPGGPDAPDGLPAIDRNRLSALAAPSVLGGGRPVGAVRVIF
jgi:L-asparaginase II